jgi:hypothetical protein
MLPRTLLVLATVATSTGFRATPRTAGADRGASSADTVLHIPIVSSGQPLLCKSRLVAPDSTFPREHIELDLFVGRGVGPSPPPREIFALFDTTGGPLALSDAVTRDGTNGDALGGEDVGVVFAGGARIVGRYASTTVDSAAKARMNAALGRGDFAGIRAVVPPPTSRALTQDEQERATALMAWLWSHRCRPTPSDGTPPPRR